jgi:hypothetical protein
VNNSALPHGLEPISGASQDQEKRRIFLLNSINPLKILDSYERMAIVRLTNVIVWLTNVTLRSLNTLSLGRLILLIGGLEPILPWGRCQL